MDTIKQATIAVTDSLPAIPGITPRVLGQEALREPPVEEWLKADEVETVEPDEEEKARQIGELMNKQQQRNFDKHQHVFRGTHVKSLAFVKGTLKVHPDLSPHLAQGIFQSGATYPVIARYANEPTFILADTTRAPRGLGLKIFNVEGERLDDDYPTGTQDFMFNNAPMVELTDVQTTLEIMTLRERYFDEPTKLAGALALRSDRMKQFAPTTLPVNHLIGDTFYTQSSFSHGPHVAHISLAPASDAQKPFINKAAPSDATETFNREHLHDYYASNAATYTLRAQFASDTSKHAVEDASTEWDINTAPWHNLATVEFPAQETFSAERRVWWEDTIALSPWNGIKAHRPLGSINRLRRKVYAMSRAKRQEGNSSVVTFPKSADEMPE